MCSDPRESVLIRESNICSQLCVPGLCQATPLAFKGSAPPNLRISPKIPYVPTNFNTNKDSLRDV